MYGARAGCSTDGPVNGRVRGAGSTVVRGVVGEAGRSCGAST